MSTGSVRRRNHIKKTKLLKKCQKKLYTISYGYLEINKNDHLKICLEKLRTNDCSAYFRYSELSIFVCDSVYVGFVIINKHILDIMYLYIITIIACTTEAYARSNLTNKYYCYYYCR